MPLFQFEWKLVDAYGREKRKLFEGDFLDVATALTEAGNFNVDLAALTEMRVLQYVMKSPTIVTDTVDAGANKDEGATFSVRKADNQKHAVKVPAPIQAIRNADGTIDITNASVVAFFDNFITGDWKVSDGETMTELLSGVLDE